MKFCTDEFRNFSGVEVEAGLGNAKITSQKYEATEGCLMVLSVIVKNKQINKFIHKNLNQCQND